jgi:two-component system nitrogen regulation response regulator GlnG
MSAIPVALAPSALFGSTKGAFTGATASSTGYFEQAQTGILFLDEIGDTPLEIQAQLLRALQQREIQPVGGAIKSIDCRVIAATDAPIDQGSNFKTALRHRLAECEIILRPLREHPEDIGELLWFFIRNYLQEEGVTISRPEPDSDGREVAAWAELFHVFVRFNWPGNVRQLANCARQISLASRSALAFPAHLRDELRSDPQSLDVKREAMVTLATKSEDISEQQLEDAMAAAHYEPKPAAALLGMSRTTIYRRIDESDHLRIAGDIPEGELQRALDAFDGNVSKAALYLRVSRVGLRFRVRSIKQAKQ